MIHDCISQTLLFLNPLTLEGEKRKVYIISKMLKKFTGAEVTSYKVNCISFSFAKYLYSIIYIPDQVGPESETH